MFLTAVLQAHTDSRAKAQAAAETPAAREPRVALPAELEKALTVPVQERRRPLPSAHRSRWV